MSSASSHDPRAMAVKFAPVITMGTAWAARKGMVKGYEARTGTPAPIVSRRDASVTSRVLWAAAMAATVALVEIIVWRMLDQDD